MTDTRLCDWLLDTYKRGVDVTLLVSRDIYGAGDQVLADRCYKQLYDAGLKLHRTWQFGYYMYNHVSGVSCGSGEACGEEGSFRGTSFEKPLEVLVMCACG